jgi:enediyne biosynthesis protein E4
MTRNVTCVCLLIVIALLPGSGCKPNVPSKIPNDGAANEPDVRNGKESGQIAFRFQDRELSVLKDGAYSNGRESKMSSILEIVGGGVGCVDFDNDGNVDIVVPRGGTIDPSEKWVSGVNSVFLRSTGNWQFANQSLAARVDTSRIYSHGVLEADFDQDGFGDLLIYGYGGVVLLHNLGDGTFEDQTFGSQLNTTQWITTAAWIDLNDDQSLDLFLGSYVDWDFDRHQVCKAKTGEPDVCSPNAFNGMKNLAYLNAKDGTFVPASEILQASQPGKSLGSIAAEFQAGQGVGLYVANDLIANFMFTKQDGRFQENGFTAGVAVDESGVANGSMGVTLLDFDMDRKFDLFVTNFEHEMMALYQGVGNDLFQHRSRQVGLNRSDIRIVAFGVVADDFDGDADEDIIFTGGHVHYFPDVGPMAQLPVVLQNDAGKSFSKLMLESKFFSHATVGRGLTTADFDNDGDVDLVSTSLLDSPMVAENVLPTQHWLTISLVGTKCSRTAIGATVELTLPMAKGASVAQRPMVRQLYSGGSYLSQRQQRLHFSWPKNEIQSSEVHVSVRWPGQIEQQELTAKTDSHIIVVQGR